MLDVLGPLLSLTFNLGFQGLICLRNVRNWHMSHCEMIIKCNNCKYDWYCHHFERNILDGVFRGEEMFCYGWNEGWLIWLVIWCGMQLFFLLATLRNRSKPNRFWMYHFLITFLPVGLAYLIITYRSLYWCRSRRYTDPISHFNWLQVYQCICLDLVIFYVIFADENCKTTNH